jgi:hypothetical protein
METCETVLNWMNTKLKKAKNQVEFDRLIKEYVDVEIRKSMVYAGVSSDVIEQRFATKTTRNKCKSKTNDEEKESDEDDDDSPVQKKQKQNFKQPENSERGDKSRNGSNDEDAMVKTVVNDSDDEVNTADEGNPAVEVEVHLTDDVEVAVTDGHESENEICEADLLENGLDVDNHNDHSSLHMNDEDENNYSSNELEETDEDIGSNCVTQDEQEETVLLNDEDEM